MAIKTISYTVSALGIEPRTKQFCGVQGDHNIYSLQFNIDSVLWNALRGKAVNGSKLYYRFDLYNGEGATTSTTPQALEDQTIVFDVEIWLTRFGGVGKVVLVITLSEDSITHLERYSFPALLQFKNRPTGSEPNEKGYQSMTTLAKMAEAAADKALTAKEEVEDKVEELSKVFEKGANVVFDGNRGAFEGGVWGVISSEVKENDPNAVAGDAVFEAIEALRTEISAELEKYKTDVIDKAYPIGSIYGSRESTNPSEFLGGKWNQITDAYLYAAGEKDAIGEAVGQNEVKLTENHIPLHKHQGLYYNGSTPVNLARYTTTDLKGVRIEWLSDQAIYPSASLKTGDNTYESGTQIAVPIEPIRKAYYWWERVE